MSSDETGSAGDENLGGRRDHFAFVNANICQYEWMMRWRQYAPDELKIALTVRSRIVMSWIIDQLST
jgi:hypothetical protein